MKKAQFDFEPQLTTDEGGVLHICFEAEAKEITVNNMHGDDTEAETRTVYEAYSVRLERPITYERVVSAIVNAEYSSDQMQAIINNHLLDSTDNAEHEAEFTAMQEWRTLAKKVAHEVIIATGGGTD